MYAGFERLGSDQNLQHHTILGVAENMWNERISGRRVQAVVGLDRENQGDFGFHQISFSVNDKRSINHLMSCFLGMVFIFLIPAERLSKPWRT